jgi:hypothetical protein
MPRPRVPRPTPEIEAIRAQINLGTQRLNNGKLKLDLYLVKVLKDVQDECEQQTTPN